ncbi:MAG: heavy-metal-associated domain-containing protein [Planctomycetota bacterium]
MVQVTTALRRVRGVSYAHVNRTKDEATVIRQVGTASDLQLENAVRNAGYGAKVIPIDSMTLTVSNMTGQGAPDRMKRTLQRVPGVRGVAVEKRKVARVQYDRRRTSRTKILQAVKRAGFQARYATPKRSQPARAATTPRPPKKTTSTPPGRTTAR